MALIKRARRRCMAAHDFAHSLGSRAITWRVQFERNSGHEVSPIFTAKPSRAVAFGERYGAAVVQEWRCATTMQQQMRNWPTWLAEPA